MRGSLLLLGEMKWILGVGPGTQLSEESGIREEAMTDSRLRSSF
jgi:hypothetical protein